MMEADPRPLGRREHWDAVYRRDVVELSWYQSEPTVSLQLIEALSVSASTPIIDIGGGASTLVDALLSRNFSDLSILDASASGLETAKYRLGPAGERVKWLVEDLLTWTPTRRYGLWHDRAVFHFLVEESDRQVYRHQLDAAIGAGGLVIVGTFASDGPLRCSGLPVARYGPEELITTLGRNFELVSSRREEHRTPAGIVQPFTWAALQKKPD